MAAMMVVDEKSLRALKEESLSQRLQRWTFSSAILVPDTQLQILYSGLLLDLSDYWNGPGAWHWPLFSSPGRRLFPSFNIESVSPRLPPPLTGDELLPRVSVSVRRQSLDHHYAPRRLLSTDPQIVGGWRGKKQKSKKKKTEEDTWEHWNVWQIIFVRNSPCVKYPLQPATHVPSACRLGSAPHFTFAVSSWGLNGVSHGSPSSGRLRNGWRGIVAFSSGRLTPEPNPPVRWC